MSDGSSVERFPWWARVLDIITVAATLLALTVFITGGFREWTPVGRVSITSWIRPLVLAVMCLIVRHAFRPRPILPDLVYRGVRTWWTASEARSIWPTFVATRVGVYAIGFLALAIIGYAPQTPPFRIYENELRNLPARWDTGWYLGVAVEGYRWNPRSMDRQQNIAFFPMYPMLMRYTSLFVARDKLWAGVIISMVSFFFASIYLFRLARQMIGGEAASFAVALVATYPFALFYSAAYTESLFLLTIVAACYHFERDELWQAGLWGLIAGLTRPNGCLLSVVLALMAIRPLWSSGWRPTWPTTMQWTRLADRLATAALPGIGMLIYSTYVFFSHGQSAAVGPSERRMGKGLSQSGYARRPTRHLDRSRRFVRVRLDPDVGHAAGDGRDLRAGQRVGGVPAYRSCVCGHDRHQRGPASHHGRPSLHGSDDLRLVPHVHLARGCSPRHPTLCLDHGLCRVAGAMRDLVLHVVSAVLKVPGCLMCLSALVLVRKVLEVLKVPKVLNGSVLTRTSRTLCT